MGVSRRWALAWVKAEDGDERNDSHANSFFSASACSSSKRPQSSPGARSRTYSAPLTRNRTTC